MRVRLVAVALAAILVLQHQCPQGQAFYRLRRNLLKFSITANW